MSDPFCVNFFFPAPYFWDSLLASVVCLPPKSGACLCRLSEISAGRLNVAWDLVVDLLLFEARR